MVPTESRSGSALIGIFLRPVQRSPRCPAGARSSPDESEKVHLVQAERNRSGSARPASVRRQYAFVALGSPRWVVGCAVVDHRSVDHGDHGMQTDEGSGPKAQITKRS
jgi:hypothetical protein